MCMNKAYKYRIYPTTKQRELFLRTFGCCRFLWNIMLSDKISYYKEHNAMLYNTPAQYKNDYPFLKEVDSLALANVQLHLQSAYKNFFSDTSVGFPKFKSKKRSKNSYTTNNQNGTVTIGDGFIRLPKIGKVKAVIHRHAPSNWKLKSATISRESDGSFYVSVLYEYKETAVLPAIDDAKALGLDYKSNGLYMDSNGNCCDMPHYYRNAQKRLANAQRKLKHKTLGSKNYYKQQRRIAKIQRHTANQRKDYLHKLSAEITNQYDIICVESLNMKAMSNKGFGNGKATLDNAYGMFLNMLSYKQTEKGHLLIETDKYFPSSQICHACGHRQKLALSERNFVCPNCGTSADRDHNAAINIKTEGLRIYHEQIVA